MEQGSKPSNSVRSIFTRSKANEGVVVQLKDFPGQWIRVRGQDSDAVMNAVTEFYRAKAEAGKDAAEYKGSPFENLDVIASMISEWSFDDPLTPELLRETLQEAPTMKVTAINESLERASFLPQNASPSSSTPEPISS